MQAAKSEDDNRSWESTLSGWMDGDGELRPEDLNTPYGRQIWDTYHLIGDVMRSDELAIKPSDLFYARVSKAIDAEPPIVAPRRNRSAARFGLSGIALAAALASVVWVSLPYISTSSEYDSPQLAAASQEPTGVNDYIQAHRQYAGINAARHVSFYDGALRQ